MAAPKKKIMALVKLQIPAGKAYDISAGPVP